MNTVYNPLTGQWERVDDVARPFPVIARDARFMVANDTTPFIPTLATSNAPNQTDIFGNTVAGQGANIGIAVGDTSADVVIPDPWRIRRFIVMCGRTGTGSTNVAIHCVVYGRLLAPDGTPTSWRTIATVSESGSNFTNLRFVLPGSLSGVFGYDQYRIVFRRDPNSEPAPELSLIRVYAEF